MNNNLTLPRIVIYKDYNGNIKRSYAQNWYMAIALFQTIFDPGLLIPTRNGGLKKVPGPRRDILYTFTIKNHRINEYPGY